jgi:hypothetical protein
MSLTRLICERSTMNPRRLISPEFWLRPDFWTLSSVRRRRVAVMGLALTAIAMSMQLARSDGFFELPLDKTLQQFGASEFGGVRLITFAVLETFNPTKRYVLRLYGAPDDASGGLLTEIGAYATQDPVEPPLALEQVNFADCSGRQLVLGTLGTGAGRSVVLGEATRIRRTSGENRRVSQADPEIQHLRLFVLARNTSEEPGRTPLYFRLAKEIDTSKALCEPETVREALKSELSHLDLPKKAP